VWARLRHGGIRTSPRRVLRLMRGADASYREYRPYVSGQALKATIDH
jgi:hypothetical protein